MKKLFLLMLSFILYLTIKPCFTEGATINHELLYYNLYCNDYQIDLSRYPLFKVYTENDELGTVYISHKIYTIAEIMGLYYAGVNYYTKDYLEQSGEFFSRAVLEAKLKAYKEAHGGSGFSAIYYSEDIRAFRYAIGGPAGGSFPTYMCGLDAYVPKTNLYDSIIAHESMVNELFDMDINEDSLTDYTSELSFAPVIYPDENKDYSPKANLDYAFYDTGVTWEIKKNLKPTGAGKYEPYELISGKNSFYYPLQSTYEFLGCAVIFDATKKTVFIYTKDYVEENPEWTTVKRAIAIASILCKNSNEKINIHYNESENSLIVRNDKSSITMLVAVFSDGERYVQIQEVFNAVNKMKDAR